MLPLILSCCEGSLDASGAASGPESEPVLTLHAAVQQALANSPRAQAATDEAMRGRLDVQQAELVFSPQVTPEAYGALGNTELANQSMGVEYTQRLHSGAQLRGRVRTTSSRNQLGTYYFGETQMLLSQPLLQGFGRRAARAAAGSAATRLRVSERALVRAEEDIALDVAAAYYALVTQVGRRAIAERALVRARALVAQSAARMKAGLVSQVEVLRAEQLASQADAELVNVTAGVEATQDELRFLLAWNHDREVVVVTEVGDVPSSPPPADSAVRVAFERRLDLASGDDLVADTERNVETSRSLTLPQLDLQLAVARQSAASDPWSSLREGGPFRASTFVATSFPLNRGDMGIARARAELAHRAQLRARDELRRQVAMDVRRALREQTRAAQQQQLAAHSAELARREVDVAQFRFDRGLSSNLDVISAEVTLLAAQQQEVEAKAAIAMARLRVMQAMGTFRPRDPVY